tara:strand:+ start:3557 stop:3769 length:213 start_codon:yes stop_codon:yes gene_type:complete
MAKVQNKKTKVGRKPLPEGEKRQMECMRLHPKVLKKLEWIKEKKGTSKSKIVEDLVTKEHDSLKSRKRKR